MKGLCAFASGLIFAIGLGISGMTMPSKVTGFLDVAGAWDPSLAFVMMGAIGVFASTYALSKRMAKPWLEASFVEPTPKKIDATLLIGSALFGIGWGLVGYCPGPALVALMTGALPAVVFCAVMTASLWLTRAVLARRDLD